MAFDFATDRVRINSAVGGLNISATMPAMDLMVLALKRAGVLEVSVGPAAPTANQEKTAWLNPAVPSHSGDGTMFMWNGAAYAPATMELFANMLLRNASETPQPSVQIGVLDEL